MWYKFAIYHFNAVLEANVAVNRMQTHVTISNLAVSDVDNEDIVIKVPYSGTLGTARFQGFAFDSGEDLNNKQ